MSLKRQIEPVDSSHVKCLDFILRTKESFEGLSNNVLTRSHFKHYCGFHEYKGFGWETARVKTRKADFYCSGPLTSSDFEIKNK